MSYNVRIAGPARRYLGRLDHNSQERIARRLAQIAADPFGPYSKALVQPPSYRAARVGGWRIIFTLDTTAGIINVIAIAPRGQVYRGV